MACLPRIAIATPAAGPEPAPAALAMLWALARCRRRVQHFRSLARPSGIEQVAAITGLPGRHLDAWLMPPEVCRQVFVRGSRQAVLAVVEGTLEDVDIAPGRRPYDRPGRLSPLAEALDLPTIALLDVRALTSGGHLPRLGDRVGAIVLDHLDDQASFESVRDLVVTLFRRPVLGAVESMPAAREGLRDAAPDRPPPIDRVEALGRSFLANADLPALLAFSESKPLPMPTCPWSADPGIGRRFRVAYAMDEAFGGYFPDTLETLEDLGAELDAFSPLRSESLPPDVDLVMIGCGFPDEHADDLAGNLSLISALRDHVCQGRRIYAEGGGAAYLGRSMILGDDRRVPGAGILPICARLRREPPPPYPVTRTLLKPGWLGEKGFEVRGYHSGRWDFASGAEPGDCSGRSGYLTAEGDVAFRHHAVGSLLHLHLASLPEVVTAFVGDHPPSLGLPPARRQAGNLVDG